MNQAETARIKADFLGCGYDIVPFGAAADACVIHTCAVTAKAEQECIRLARGAKAAYPGMVVVLAGCAAEVDDAHLKAASAADVVAGRKAKFNLPAILAGISTGSDQTRVGEAVASVSRTAISPAPPVFDTTRAWVKAQDGCSFACAFCVVPLARGPSQSRPFLEIIEETMMLADAGYREVVITGANLGCYRDGTHSLVDVLDQIERLEGIRRMRLSSIECSTAEYAVVEYMATSSKLCRYLHLPLQTGDDRLLKDMGRRYTAREYRHLVEFIHSRMPLAGIGTDIITGLPGEDERAFANTAGLIRDLPFSNLHVFPYSPRRRTPAASMQNQVPRRVAKTRAALLTALGKVKRQEFAEQFCGRAVDILVEHVDSGGLRSGWTGEYILAHTVHPDATVNDVVTCCPNRCENAVLLD